MDLTTMPTEEQVESIIEKRPYLIYLKLKTEPFFRFGIGSTSDGRNIALYDLQKAHDFGFLNNILTIADNWYWSSPVNTRKLPFEAFVSDPVLFNKVIIMIPKRSIMSQEGYIYDIYNDYGKHIKKTKIEII